MIIVRLLAPANVCRACCGLLRRAHCQGLSYASCGSDYPEARVKRGPQKLWLKDDLDQAILPPELASPRDLAEDL